MKEEVILTILPHQLREVLKRENIDFQSIQEIRLRVGKPLILLYRGNEVIPEADGRPYYITKDEIREMLDYISGYSLYSYEREMSQGYITIEGGHRVGLSGQAIMENGKVKNLMIMLIRSMRPEVIAVDEIGGSEDVHAIEYGRDEKRYSNANESANLSRSKCRHIDYHILDITKEYLVVNEKP